MRLLNGLPAPVDKCRHSEFRLAAMIADANAGYIKSDSLGPEIQRLDLPVDISDLIMALLVTNDQTRRTADDVLLNESLGKTLDVR